MSAHNWQEIGDRIFRGRFDLPDLNIGLVVADEVALVIDSRSTHDQADELIAEVAGLTNAPIGFLVNTHHHWDHTFGNARFLPGAEIVGHTRCRHTLIERGEEMKRGLLAAEWLPEEAKPYFAAVEITPPQTVFDDRMTMMVGGREVSLAHLGRGHTDNDIVITVDDVVFAGDLVEEGGPPQFGDAYPGEWLRTLQLLADRAGDIVVPGHGNIVDRDFVINQRDEMSRAIQGEQMFPAEIMVQLRVRLQTD